MSNPYQIPNTSYIILEDGTVARRLKPRTRNKTLHWSIKLDGKLRSLNQKVIDDVRNGLDIRTYVLENDAKTSAENTNEASE